MAWLIYHFYRLLTWTWRIQVHVSPDLRAYLDANVPVVFAHWHGDELAIVHLIPRFRIATLTSVSQDGQLMAQVIHLFGGVTARGSSSKRGASGLLGLVKLMKRGWNASLAVDGPKGPLYKVKPGVFQLTHLADATLAVVGVAAWPVYQFKRSWNKTYLPYPFAKVVIWLSLPSPQYDKSKDVVDQSRDLEEALANARRQALCALRG